ncbi:MAG TPA: AAA family ATPase [Patescibacteria group bacterium]|nr:AAA family ATPase [Patescibacteria group bacterium]
MPIHLRLLGSPDVTRDGEPVRFDTRKATALLARLAVRGQPEARDSLASLLWPEYDQAHASAALRRTLSVARAALGGSGLAIEGRTVALGPEVTSDVERAGERLGSVRTHHATDEDPCDACRDALRDLVALHRGTFLDGFSLRDSPEFDDWQAGIAAEMTEQHADALRRLVEAELARGDMEAALDVARRWAALDPLQEAAHVAVMTVHARRGDRVAALRQYRECARILEEELGVAPLPETTALSDRIRAAEAQVVGSMPVAPHPVAPQRTPPLPFVGRATEHQLLVDSWRDAASGRGRLVLVEGEPGIGKTRLVAEAAATITADGGRVLALRCFEGETMLAFAPLADALARLADEDRAAFLGHAPEHAVQAAGRLVPGLLSGPPRPEPELDEATASRRTVDGLASAIATLATLATDGREGGMVWVDDAQWADHGTAAMLGYLARRLDRHRLSLVIGRRPVGDRSDPIAAAVTTAGRDGRLIALPLERLGAAEVQRLLREAGAATDDRLVSELMTESEGNPFYLSEYLAHASGRRADEAATLPPTVRALVLSRLAAIADLDLQILGAGAIIGRTFDVELVRRVSGRRPEEAVLSLERLRDHGLLVERPAARGSAEWDFDHDKTRAVVLQEMTVSRRRLLHRRAAAALETWRSPGGRRPWGTIAAHLLEASEPRVAAHRFRRAGDEAAALHANAEALTHYRAALAHAPSEMASLRVRIGDLETLQGGYRAALAAYEAAAATASEDEVRDLDHRIARVHLRRGEWGLALERLDSAMDGLPDDDHQRRARLLTDASLAAARVGDTAAAEQRARAALEAAEATHDQALMAEAHNRLGLLARGSDDSAARRHLDEAVRLAEESGVLAAIMAARNNRARLALADGDVADAERLTRAALTIATGIGDRHREAALRTNLADILHAAGARVEARDEVSRSAALFADIGEPGTLEPEIWKLVEW